MKRDLIYLTLIVSAIWAAHATAKAVQDGPQQIEPRKIEAGFTKTVHILFPSPVTYIDIGSMDIIAGKADGAENVVRVKAAVRNFAAETNLTVITEDGGFSLSMSTMPRTLLSRPSILQCRINRRKV